MIVLHEHSNISRKFRASRNAYEYMMNGSRYTTHTHIFIYKHTHIHTSIDELVIPSSKRRVDAIGTNEEQTSVGINVGKRESVS